MLPQNQSAEPNQSLHKTEKRRAKRKAARSVRVLRLLRIFVGSVIAGSLVATYGFKGSLLSSVLTLLMIAFVPDTVAKITQRFFVREMSRQLATSLPLLERDSVIVLLDYYAEAKCGKHSESVEQRLIEVLPTLQISDRFLLKRRHHETMDDILRSSKFPLIIALLEGLEKAGGKEEYSMVASLANGLHAGATSQEVCHAAEKCVALILERREAERKGGMLLRPSFPPEPPETLLRAIESSPDPETETLLRPHTPEPPSLTVPIEKTEEEAVNKLTH